ITHASGVFATSIRMLLTRSVQVCTFTPPQPLPLPMNSQRVYCRAMAIDKELLAILVCPENKTPLTLAGGETIEMVNGRIRGGQLTNRSGAPVKAEIEAGLVRADGKYLYPIRDDIP